MHWGRGEQTERRNDKETGSTGQITGRTVGFVKGRRVPGGSQVEVWVLAWALRGQSPTPREETQDDTGCGEGTFRI